jgi:hypothetical protein
VAELTETLTPSEYRMWLVWYAEREVHRKREENRRRGVIDFTDPQATQQLLTQLGGHK